MLLSIPSNVYNYESLDSNSPVLPMKDAIALVGRFHDGNNKWKVMVYSFRSFNTSSPASFAT